MTRGTFEALLCACALSALACDGGPPKADGPEKGAATHDEATQEDEAAGAEAADGCAGVELPALDGTFAPEKSAQLLTMGKVAGATYRNKVGGDDYDVPQLVIEGATTWPSEGGGTNRLAVTYTQMFLPNMTALEPKAAAENVTRLEETAKKAKATELMADPITLGDKKLPGYAYQSGASAELNVWAPIAGSTRHQLVKVEVSARLNAQCDAKFGEWAKAFFGTLALNEASTFAELETVKREL